MIITAHLVQAVSLSLPLHFFPPLSFFPYLSASLTLSTDEAARKAAIAGPATSG